MGLDFKHFEGQHCETTATGTLLRQQGLELSEPMLFGLGEGLGFIFLNLSGLNLPFVGGRTKPFELTRNLCNNLGLDLRDQETTSRRTAFGSLCKLLAEGKCVGLQLDSYYLDYFTTKVHFAGHFVAAHGFDETNFFLVDTQQQGSLQQISHQSLEQARFAKGSMSAKARSWTIAVQSGAIDWKRAILKAVKSNAQAYLAPPFKGANFQGIDKLSQSLPRWLEVAKEPANDLALVALLMERAGTGGSIFRNFYRDFLSESAEIVKSAEIRKGCSLFTEIASQWLEVAELLEETSKTLNPTSLNQASQICRRIASAEVEAMRVLAQV